MIGEKISKYRKEKNMTQEQLAAAIGVSAGAVCKWETQKSTPDISLLAPLARVLSVTLDELLSFKPCLSEEDVRNIKQELIPVFIHIGYETGEERCAKLIKEYPNSNCLKLAIAGLLQVYAMLPDDLDEELYQKRLNHAIDLCRTVIESNEVKYVSQAQFVLSNIYMMLGNYEESEKIMKQLIGYYVDPMNLYPQLLQRQGKRGEAKLLCEQLLLARLNHSTTLLSILANISLEEENEELAYQYIEHMIKVQELFKIGLSSGEHNRCNYYIRTNQLELAAKSFRRYAEGLLSAEYDYSNNVLLKEIKLEVNPMEQKMMRKKMLQAQLMEHKFDILAGHKEYEEAITMLQSYVNSDK